ncbi:hypothetical protein Pfo_006207 [Paulownia fortunei]|nr:hypothetical protein Pfo_006207 [Paulownia fortunei]
MSLALCILFLLLQKHAMTAKTNGMTLPLIHPEFHESPVFESNPTHEQRIQRLIYQSHARAAGHLSTIVSSVAKSKSSHNMDPDLVRPQVGIQSPYYYMVKIGIGTFKTKPSYPSFKSYYLYMDTGSDLSWMQCEGCRAPGGRCFAQKEPVYPNSRSGSYHPLPCNKHSLCVPNQCINNSCSYNVRYLDSTSSSGILASENFAFTSDVGQMEFVKNLIFGCGVDNRKSYGNNSNQIAGIMGLGWGSYSILSQANSLTEGKFSYCLPAINKYTQKWPNTYLRFGRDIVKRTNLSVTPLLRNKDQKVYHVILQGISINSKKLSISDQDFRLRSDGSGGCIIDSGTPFSRLIKPAYIVLEKALKGYFWGQRNLKPYKGPKGFELCYERKKAQGYKNLPSMTFHFKNANLVVRAEALFLVMDKISSVKGEYFCLAILPSDFISVLGSYQQTNQRFIYDTKQKQLLFSPNDCSKDA